MNKILVLALCCIVPFAALAGGSVVYSAVLSEGAAAPNSASIGIPLEVNGNSVKAINLTVLDYDDGGQPGNGASDNDNICGFTAFALVYTPHALGANDGGGKWVKTPELDMTVTLVPPDGGVCVERMAIGPFANRGISKSLPSPIIAGGALQRGNGARLMYQLYGVTNVDGGVNDRRQMVLEGRY